MQRKLVLRRGRGGWVKVRFGKFSTLKASITYLVPLFRHLFSPVAFRPPSHSWVLQDSLRSLWSLWVGARRTGNIFEKKQKEETAMWLTAQGGACCPPLCELIKQLFLKNVFFCLRIIYWTKLRYTEILLGRTVTCVVTVPAYKSKLTRCERFPFLINNYL